MPRMYSVSTNKLLLSISIGPKLNLLHCYHIILQFFVVQYAPYPCSSPSRHSLLETYSLTLGFVLMMLPISMMRLVSVCFYLVFDTHETDKSQRVKFQSKLLRDHSRYPLSTASDLGLDPHGSLSRVVMRVHFRSHDMPI